MAPSRGSEARTKACALATAAVRAIEAPTRTMTAAIRRTGFTSLLRAGPVQASRPSPACPDDESGSPDHQPDSPDHDRDQGQAASAVRTVAGGAGERLSGPGHPGKLAVQPFRELARRGVLDRELHAGGIFDVGERGRPRSERLVHLLAL